jgi:hypothetical protein
VCEHVRLVAHVRNVAAALHRGAAIKTRPRSTRPLEALCPRTSISANAAHISSKFCAFPCFLRILKALSGTPRAHQTRPNCEHRPTKGQPVQGRCPPPPREPRVGSCGSGGCSCHCRLPCQPLLPCLLPWPGQLTTLRSRYRPLACTRLHQTYLKYITGVWYAPASPPRAPRNVAESSGQPGRRLSLIATIRTSHQSSGFRFRKCRNRRGCRSSSPAARARGEFDSVYLIKGGRGGSGGGRVGGGGEGEGRRPAYFILH